MGNGIVKKNSQPQLSAMADNLGYRWLCCYFLNLLLIFQNSEEAILFHLWHISLTFIFLILSLVFVVEMQHFKKEMHSHNLSAMADTPETYYIIPSWVILNIVTGKCLI